MTEETTIKQIIENMKKIGIKEMKLVTPNQAMYISEKGISGYLIKSSFKPIKIDNRRIRE